jgi:diadenosine tetraphosphatase ApaH/serine/threonine PP2A family protein phosphatase
MQAFISDVHGNLEALISVLEHMSALGITEVYCLGDVVGYGPDPRECLARSKAFGLCLKGNHEEALLGSPVDFNPQARTALEWTREKVNGENRAWIAGLPEMAVDGAFAFAHGSPRDPVREYVMPQDAGNAGKMKAIFERLEQQVCFVGHSHVPGVFTEDGRYLPQCRLDGGYRPGPGRALVNIGSVGQPRDGDPRACYVTWDGERVVYHRVPYDVETTMEKIMETKALPEMLALRLKDGI